MADVGTSPDVRPSTQPPPSSSELPPLPDVKPEPNPVTTGTAAGRTMTDAQLGIARASDESFIAPGERKTRPGTYDVQGNRVDQGGGPTSPELPPSPTMKDLKPVGQGADPAGELRSKMDPTSTTTTMPTFPETPPAGAGVAQGAAAEKAPPNVQKEGIAQRIYNALKNVRGKQQEKQPEPVH